MPEQKLDIATEREICDAATPGPWSRDTFFLVGQVPQGRPHGEVIATFRPTAGSIHRVVPNEANAEFCAHVRTAYPKALDELEHLRAKVETVTLERDAAEEEVANLRAENTRLREALAKESPMTNEERWWASEVFRALCRRSPQAAGGGVMATEEGQRVLDDLKAFIRGLLKEIDNLNQDRRALKAHADAIAKAAQAVVDPDSIPWDSRLSADQAAAALARRVDNYRKWEEENADTERA